MQNLWFQIQKVFISYLVHTSSNSSQLAHLSPEAILQEEDLTLIGMSYEIKKNVHL